MRKLSQQPGQGRELSPPRRRLLYVEDNDDNWSVAQLRLGHLVQLERAENSEQACRAVRDRRHEFALILMDIELRGSELNGEELTKLFRGDRLDVPLPAYARDMPLFGRPIIFVTAHGAKFSPEQLLRAGGTRVISKPIDFNELREAIEELADDHTNVARR